MFTTKIDTLEKHDGKSLVVVLGDCSVPDTLDPGRVIRFPDVSSPTMKVINGIDVRAYQQGITLVVASELIDNSYNSVRLIQKHLLFLYVKFIWFPMRDTATPDPFGVGGDKGPLAGLLYDVTKLENLPYLMGSPRTKDLEGRLPSMPVLLLAPGPSLSEIGPHLKELSKRFLILCLARNLSFCQQYGVVPDVVIQLDTHGEQQNFYPADMDFSKSRLLALSMARVKKYVHRFAGVYWIDTFEPSAFNDDTYEMRNSWLSSLIAMLGAAQLFQPKKVLVTGVDLSFISQAYFDGLDVEESEKQHLSDEDEIAAVFGDFMIHEGNYDFPIHLNDGSVGLTRQQYLATAYEAEVIASELSATTKFYNLSQSSILEEAFYPFKDAPEFLAEPELDKSVLDEAFAVIENDFQGADENIIQKGLRSRLAVANQLVSDIDKGMATVDPAVLEQSPLVSAGKVLNGVHRVYDPQKKCFLSQQVIHQYKKMLVSRIQYYRLKSWAAMGKSIPVYCYPHEIADLETALQSRFPKGKWEFRTSWADGTDAVVNRVVSQRLAHNLINEPISLMTTRYEESADYLLPYFEFDSYLNVDEILRAPWPTTAS